MGTFPFLEEWKMKAVRCSCGRLTLGVLGVGALAFGFSVFSASGEDRSSPVRGQVKSEAVRVVTGPTAQLEAAVAGHNPGTAEFYLTPVPPIIGGGYGAVDISGQTLTLPAKPPKRVYLEAKLKGWSAQALKTWQYRMNAAGLLGANADCDGKASNGDDIMPAIEKCTQKCVGGVNIGLPCDSTILPTQCPLSSCQSKVCDGGGTPGAACINNAGCPGGGICKEYCAIVFGESGSICDIRPTWAGGLGPDKICTPGYQNRSRADWVFIDQETDVVASTDTSTLNIRGGAVASIGAATDAGQTAYGMTIVLDVPQDAAGVYTIDAIAAESFMKDDKTPLANNIDIAHLYSAVIDVACGRCCFGLGTGAVSCIDNIGAGECQKQTAVSIFQEGEKCPPLGDDCPSCTQDSDCADGDGCTQDHCDVPTGVCSNPRIGTWVVGTCCNNGTVTTPNCPDQCNEVACSVPPDRGTAVCNARDGAACDDDNDCTIDDVCLPGKVCEGTDVNSISCTTPLDCGLKTGSSYPCEPGACGGGPNGPNCCVCTLTPDLDFEIDPEPSGKDDPNCFEEGQKITGTVSVGPASGAINGGSFLIAYDPTCMEYKGLSCLPPYVNVYGPVVDAGAGEIYIACGVNFGVGNGPNGSVAMAGFSFNKIGHCNNCVLCFDDDNPRHTILVDNEGQPVKVLPRCSKDISDNNVVDVNVPDNIKTNSDCNKPTAAVSWDPPTAKDDCGEATLFCRGVTREGLVYSQADILDGGVFPQGISNFCCYAVSDWKCHKIGGCPPDTDCERDAGGKPIGCWTVEVTTRPAWTSRSVWSRAAARRRPG
jgi:hypothetical protein